MTAILKLIPIEKIVLWMLARLRGITAEQWKAAVRLVVYAADEFSTKEKRHAYVQEQLTRENITKNLNWLIATAVAYKFPEK